MFLRQSKHLFRTLDILLLLQLVAYMTVVAMVYIWRDLDELVYTGQVQLVGTLVATFVATTSSR